MPSFSPGDLDEAVLQCYECKASNVNNEGVEAQIKFLKSEGYTLQDFKGLAAEAGYDVYTVIVGNVGCVYSGESDTEAKRIYDVYVHISQAGTGRAGGVPVYMLKSGDMLSEHIPSK